jgi:hypothetical protein
MRTVVLALALALPACGDGTPDALDACTTEARASVQIEVFDTDGAPIDEATATYTVDGGDPQDCFVALPGEVVCGFELTGAFSVTVAAPGYASATVEATVEPGECHVETAVLDVTLEPADPI